MILKFASRNLKIELNDFIKRYWFKSTYFSRFIIYDASGEQRHGINLNQIRNEKLKDFKYDKKNKELTLYIDL